MATKDPEELLERFHEVLYKMPPGGGMAPGDRIWEPGEEITLKISEVGDPIETNPMLTWMGFFTKLPEVRLDEESQLKLGALLLHMANSQADTEFGSWLTLRLGHGSAFKEREQGEKAARYWEKLKQYVKRQQIAHVEPERFVAAIGELGEPDPVEAVLALLREVDPARAEAVAAALPPGPEEMLDEIEALRRQVSELEAERDALLKARQP